jgi:hypothetical protein
MYTREDGREKGSMPRIIVTTEQSKRPDGRVLLDERVHPDHLSDDHAAAQLVERIGWAVTDASDVERDPAERPAERDVSTTPP